LVITVDTRINRSGYTGRDIPDRNGSSGNYSSCRIDHAANKVGRRRLRLAKAGRGGAGDKDRQDDKS